MPERRYDLPSLTALASFEAAARHVGFKRAAAELNVTPAAVSHQVKTLEADLGLALFRRHHRGVELTEAGAFLFVAIQRGFEGIADAVGQLRMRPATDAATIQATTAVSALWLTPRLTQFWTAHGHIAVSQTVTDAPGTMPGSDLRIFYGDAGQEGGDCRLLFRDRIGVLAAPGFAERHGVRTIAHLARAPIVELRAEDSRWTGWQSWCAQTGYDGALGAALYVNNYAIALQAAQDGVGAVLGWEVLTERLVAAGALAPLFDTAIPAPHEFWIRTRRNAPARALVLRDWLVASAAAAEGRAGSSGLSGCS